MQRVFFSCGVLGVLSLIIGSAAAEDVEIQVQNGAIEAESVDAVFSVQVDGAPNFNWQQLVPALPQGTFFQAGPRTNLNLLTEDVEVDVQAFQTGKYWLGLQCVELTPELKQDLGIENGVMVRKVFEGSVAAMKGIKEGDILLTYGGKPLSTAMDLVKAVGTGDEQPEEAEIEYLRPSRKTLKIQPAERPRIEATEAKPAFSNQMMFVGPGMFMGKADFPEYLSVSITKQGKEEAKIVVKSGDEKWEIEREEICKLPEEIQGHVRGFLGIPNIVTIRGMAVEGAPAVPHIEMKEIRGVPKMVLPHVDIPRVRVAPAPNQAIEELRKEIQKLREEVNELKK